MRERIPENKMGTMPVGKLLADMAIPMMISMLVQALYNVVDSVFVSRISENALNAVSLAFPLQNLMIAFGSGTAVGSPAEDSAAGSAAAEEAGSAAAGWMLPDKRKQISGIKKESRANRASSSSVLRMGKSPSCGAYGPPCNFAEGRVQ